MKKFLISCLIFILIVAGIIGVGYVWFKSESKVLAGSVQIAEGSTVKQIAQLLEQDGIINNSNVFYYYIRLKQMYYEKVENDPNGFPTNFKHGTYEVKNGTFDSLIQFLNESEGEQEKSKMVTFPEGIDVFEMASIAEENGFYSKDEFMKVAQDKTYYETLRKKYAWLPTIHKDRKILLEGFLHANTYEVPLDSSIKDIIELMLDSTNAFYLAEKESIEKNKLPFHKLITLASVVERESKYSEDRPKVAQVFLNRMIKKMKLESDITAAYANGEHKVFMYYKDIETKSPYNTYHVTGLPIGPIASPSEESIKAVIHPEGHDFKALYFYARPSGETFYANTWQEHEKNRIKYEHEWKALEKETKK